MAPEIALETMEAAQTLIHQINSSFPETLFALLVMDDRNVVRIEKQRHYLTQQHYYETALTSVMQKFLRQLPIVMLNLSYHTFCQAQIHALVNLVRLPSLPSSSLTHLHLVRCTLDEEHLQQILQALPCATNLQMLDFERLWVTPLRSHSHSQHATTTTTTTTTTVTPWIPLLVHILPRCQSLIELRLALNKLTDADALLLIHLLQNEDTTLQKLDVSLNLFTDLTASAFAELLKANTNHTLLVLDLDYNKFTSDKGLLELAWAVGHNTTLLGLNVHSENFQSLSAEAFYYALAHNTTLIHFGGNLDERFRTVPVAAAAAAAGAGAGGAGAGGAGAGGAGAAVEVPGAAEGGGLINYYMQRNKTSRSAEFWRPYQPRGSFAYVLPLAWTALLCNQRLIDHDEKAVLLLPPSLPIDMWLYIFSFYQRLVEPTVVDFIIEE
jgi:hypothetical protein